MICPIRVRELASGEEHGYPDEYHVRFDVQPPMMRTYKGKKVRLRKEEGWINVNLENGKLVIRGSHALVIIPESSNSFSLSLRDDA